MRRSLESSRPILPQNHGSRASTRFSTYSIASSAAYTERSFGAMSNNSDRSAEVSKYAKGLDRLEIKRLQDQRYQPSSEKDDTMDKLALAAKVQRAVDRRYSSQDAVHKARAADPEKRGSSASSKR